MEKVYLQSVWLSKLNGNSITNIGSMYALGVCGAFFMPFVQFPSEPSSAQIHSGAGAGGSGFGATGAPETGVGERTSTIGGPLCTRFRGWGVGWDGPMATSPSTRRRSSSARRRRSRSASTRRTISAERARSARSFLSMRACARAQLSLPAERATGREIRTQGRGPVRPRQASGQAGRRR